MIVVAGGTKGGSGKTTVAVTLAALRSLQGRDVLLLDADDQATAYDWHVLREERREGGAGFPCVQATGAGVRSALLRLRDRFGDIVVDVAGRDSQGQRAAAAVADVLLVPVVPRSFDTWSLGKVVDIVRDMRTVNPGLAALVFLNKADPEGQGSENEETVEILREYEEFVVLDAALGSRKAHAHATSVGLVAAELRGGPRDPKAIAEAEILCRDVFGYKPGEDTVSPPAVGVHARER